MAAQAGHACRRRTKTGGHGPGRVGAKVPPLQGDSKTAVPAFSESASPAQIRTLLREVFRNVLQHHGSKLSSKIASLPASGEVARVAVLLVLLGSVAGLPTTAVAELPNAPVVPASTLPVTL
jgi:hypothetical protein